jgi:hypothetical protein
MSPLGLLASLAVFAACGGEPAAPTQPTAAPTAPPAPVATPEPKPDPTPAPTASASASAVASSKPASSGRPNVIKSDPTEIADTFGTSPGSKLELGDKDIATLRLPEGALHTATVLTFRIAKGGKASGGALGKTYQILPVVPPASEAAPIDSAGPPFVLELPSTKKDGNLAIGADDGKGKLKWTVVAPKRYDDDRKVLVFELTTLPAGFIHVTSKPAG